MERRKFPRQDVRSLPIRATLVLAGGSLLKQDSFDAFEIDAHPIDLSCGGISLLFDFIATWTTLSPQKEVELCLTQGTDRQPYRAKVIRVQTEDQTVGFEFLPPLSNDSHLLQAKVLHS